MDLSIIIPAFNEENRISDTLHSIKSYLHSKKNNFSSEVIVVSDGSTDNTVDVVTKLGDDFPELKIMHYDINKGKGYAVKQGFENSTGSIVLFMDSDGATPIEELDKIYDRIAEGNIDLGIGSRRTEASVIIQEQPAYRKILGNMFSLFVRFFLGIKFKDTQCGFKVFNGDIGRLLFKKSQCSGFAFDIEIIYIALLNGYNVEEFGVVWCDSPETKVNALQDGVKMLCYVLVLWVKRNELKKLQK